LVSKVGRSEVRVQALITCGIVLFPLSMAHAATVGSFASVGGRLLSADVGFEDVEVSDGEDATTPDEGRSTSATATLSRPDVELDARSSADAATGKFSSSASLAAPTGLHTSGIGLSSVYESFTAQGSGEVTFNLALVGGWNVESLRPGDFDSYLMLFAEMNLWQDSPDGVTYQPSGSNPTFDALV
jgi:hypothetical protein